MYKPNGSIYLGWFDHGRAQGKGVYIFDDGSYYNGDFNKNAAESKNGVYESDILHYKGGFNNNTFHGEAEEAGSDYAFTGTYNNGMRTKGILTWKKAGSQEFRYEGPFNDKNQFHGRGKLKEPNGEYEGDFVNG